MDIRYRFVGGVTIVSLSGRLTISPGESEIVPLRSAIQELIGDGHLHIGLELSDVTHIDARGLAELVLTLTTVRRAGGELTLLAPSQRVKQLLGITRLDTVFPIGEPEAPPTGVVSSQTSLSRRGLRASAGAAMAS